MQGKGLDGAAGDLGGPPDWRCAALVARDCGPGPGGLLVPSVDGEKLLKQPKPSLRSPPQLLSLAQH
jgi:hypothetical protein